MPSNRINTILQNYASWGLASSAKPQLLRQLEGGLTNQSFLLQLADECYVLRLFSPHSQQLNINREAEYRIASIAAQQGLSPQTIYLAPDHSYSISRYLDAELFNHSALSRAEKLQRLAQCLQQLHSIHIDIELPQLIVSEKAQHYWQAIAQLPAAAIYLQYKAPLQQYFKQLPVLAPPVLCHNDLVVENILLGEQGLRLIDWEYAAMGNPYFDLAAVIINQQLNAENEQLFLGSYTKSVDLLALQQAKLQVRYLECLWWLMQSPLNKNFVQQLLQDLLLATGLEGGEFQR
ncbi:phosphotransferase family protein [Dasania sp. GY-MA-18]|uniref:Phosphotransferase family protein n=1 Tax=Dasania phycosphaerae TaxID=2950436 RepID=A0A9J6RML8_9GAMM|nr:MULTISPECIES: choline/ethanolamine kinase family protein [Dasania]MCR8923001.1 phosphotransferase family protein [Dasania sp. GY-MA-18]MCZ0865432.1 phosphotransferase family protein [Dasania phycosphaerae]MCZ0869157.1 phosphotransferase family protein [Dasania phycosphaerae]